MGQAKIEKDEKLFKNKTIIDNYNLFNSKKVDVFGKDVNWEFMTKKDIIDLGALNFKYNRLNSLKKVDLSTIRKLNNSWIMKAASMWFVFLTVTYVIIYG